MNYQFMPQQGSVSQIQRVNIAIHNSLLYNSTIYIVYLLSRQTIEMHAQGILQGIAGNGKISKGIINAKSAL